MECGRALPNTHKAQMKRKLFQELRGSSRNSHPYSELPYSNLAKGKTQSKAAAEADICSQRHKHSCYNSPCDCLVPFVPHLSEEGIKLTRVGQEANY